MSHTSTARNQKPLITLFVLASILPIGLEVAGIRLSPMRMLLMALAIPAVIHVLSGKAGRVTAMDIMLLLAALWIPVTLTVAHGMTRLPYAIITATEYLAGYFLARMVVRTVDDYRYIFQLMFLALVAMCPLVIVENHTGRMIFSDIVNALPGLEAPVRGARADMRLGMERAYGLFEHPILYGLFCAMTLANLTFIFRERRLMMQLSFGFTLYMAFSSLSSAPMLACAIQIGILLWGWITKGRWRLLFVLTSVAYVVVDIISDRTPIEVLIARATLDPFTGFIRVAINDHGLKSVMAHPIFGIGLNDWVRPTWLTGSVDNFWLVLAMRHGLPAALLVLGVFFLHFIRVGLVRLEDDEAIALRVAHCTALAAIVFTLVTVHVWGAITSLVFFYVGAGAFLYTSDMSARTSGVPESALTPREMVFTRFPKAGIPLNEHPPVPVGHDRTKYKRQA